MGRKTVIQTRLAMLMEARRLSDRMMIDRIRDLDLPKDVNLYMVPGTIRSLRLGERKPGLFTAYLVSSVFGLPVEDVFPPAEILGLPPEVDA